MARPEIRGAPHERENRRIWDPLDMTERSRNYAAKTRGRPFQPGNSGRPKGARHKATVAAEILLDGEAEGLTRKAVELALGGDSAALRLCLERILPPRRERPVRFGLPSLQSPADAVKAMATIAAAVAATDLTPGEAADLAKLVDAYLEAIKTNDLDQRIRSLESALNGYQP
jgi:hypothetical protein